MKKRNPRVVVDINVIISALHFGGTPARVVTMAGLKMIHIFLPDFILQERLYLKGEKSVFASL